MNLESFWKPKIKIGIVLKSGRELTFKCSEFTYKHDGNEITGFTYKGLTGDNPLFYLRINEIAAIIKYK